MTTWHQEMDAKHDHAIDHLYRVGNRRGYDKAAINALALDRCGAPLHSLTLIEIRAITNSFRFVSPLPSSQWPDGVR